MTWIKLVLMLYFFMVAHKAECQTLSKAFLKSMKTWQRSCWCWRYFSQRMRRLKTALRFFYLLWSLPVLQRWSSPLVASICSVWLCLGDWWGLLFGSSGTAAGCFSFEVWWLRTESIVLAILKSARSYCILSWTEYCTELYNHKANGDPSVLNCTQTDTEDGHPILRREVEVAVQLLKKRKSAGVDYISSELVQAGVEDVITALTTFCNKIWQTWE